MAARRRLLPSLLAAWLGAAALIAAAPDTPATGPTRPLLLVFSRTVADYGNEADVSAAITKWTQFLGDSLEPGRPVSHELAGETAALVTAMNSGAADFAAMSSLEFLGIEARLAADPFMTYQASGETEMRYVLVARKAVTGLPQLSGKAVAVLNPNGHRHPDAVWLDVLLWEAGLDRAQATFREVRLVKKASQAVLPVYFGQLDAAVLPRSAFDTAVELNPDLGAKLHVLASSPPLLRVVACAARRISRDTTTRWAQSLSRAHEMPGARQLFTLFKLDRIVPWDPALIRNVRTLVSRHATLERAAARGRAVPAGAPR